MLNHKFSKRSEERMAGVHPDLVRIARRALELSPVDFGITEGLRTVERQRQLVAAGASKTMKSRHLTGHALDVVAYVGSEVRWDWSLYLKIAAAFKNASEEIGTPLRWGGSWKNMRDMASPITAAALSRTFPDGPHYELDITAYPL